MDASRFVGRVGGLAIALGVGAAAFGGTATAWADSTSADSSSGTGSSARSESRTSGTDTSAAGPKRGAKSAAPRTLDSTQPRSAASISIPKASSPASTTEGSSALDRAQAAQSAAPAQSTPVATTDIPADVVATPEVVAPTPAGVREAVSTTARIAPANTATDPFSGSNPAAPIGGLVDLALLEVSRRTGAVASFAPAAAAAAVSLAPEPEVQAAAAITPTIALVMTPSGVAIPTADYVPHVQELYLPAGLPAEFLFTPEGLYPISGVKSLPLNISVEEGNDILVAAIKKQVDAGETVAVFGYSQSSIISSRVMPMLQEAGIPEDKVTFILVGNEMNPNGGFLSRFPDFDMPSLGIPFYGPTPTDTPYSLVNYTLEYDGFADFPRYPLNVISVLNAGLGIAFVHGTYTNPDVTTPEDVANAILLPSSNPNQQYYIIQTENLPLLQPLRFIPIIGNAIADLLQPALRVIVNLGYGDPNYGWSTNGYANELTTFGVFPDVDPLEVISLFIDGVGQGIQDFIADILPGGSMWQEAGTLLNSVSVPLPSFSLESLSDSLNHFFASPGSVIDDVLNFVSTAVKDVADAISGSAASLYAALLPTADIINAIFTVLPAYDIDLFLDGVQTVFSGDVIGGLTDAVFMPLAATSGLLTTAALIELIVIAQGVLGAFGINVTV